MRTWSLFCGFLKLHNKKLWQTPRDNSPDKLYARQLWRGVVYNALLKLHKLTAHLLVSKQTGLINLVTSFTAWTLVAAWVWFKLKFQTFQSFTPSFPSLWICRLHIKYNHMQERSQDARFLSEFNLDWQQVSAECQPLMGEQKGSQMKNSGLRAASRTYFMFSTESLSGTIRPQVQVQTLGWLMRILFMSWGISSD